MQCLPVFKGGQGEVCATYAEPHATNANSKHIGVRHHFTRKRVLVGRNIYIYISIIHARSPNQHAHFLTQATSREPFELYLYYSCDELELIVLLDGLKLHFNWLISVLGILFLYLTFEILVFWCVGVFILNLVPGN